jgi:hypothetical protein
MRMRRLLLLACAGVWLLIGVTPAWSILIETTNKRRVAGYVVSNIGGKLVLKVPIGAGKFKEETHEKGKYTIKHQLDRDRLEKLSRDNPAAYREYAEDLAKQTADPEAIDTAMRLFVIAAHLEPAKQGRGCLLAMSALAATPAEARKYRAMAFLLDGKTDRSLLEGDGKAQAKIPAAAWQSFQQAMRKFRSGDIIQAREQAKAKDLASCFNAVPDMMDRDTFIQACTDAICPKCKYTNRNNFRCATCGGTGKDPFNSFQACPTCKGKKVVRCSACDGSGVNRTRLDEHVDATVRAELAALNRLVPAAPSAAKHGESGSWASALSNPQLTPLPAMTLETITDYDARKCVYRNGTWVAP